MSKHHNQSSSMTNVLRPTDGYRELQLRKGKKVKNHMQENYDSLRRAQMVNRARREQEEEEKNETKELFKLAQFKQVSSKLHEETAQYRHSKVLTPRNSNVNNHYDNLSGDQGEQQHFLARGTGDRRRERQRSEIVKKRQMDAWNQQAQQVASGRGSGGSSSHRSPPMPSEVSLERPVEARKPPVPSRSDRPALNRRSQKDFISSNRREADLLHPPTRTGREDGEGYHEDFGKVPEYLRERREEEAERRAWREEEARRRELCPPGMVLLPEDERVATLAKLRGNKQEVQSLLNRLPFTSDSLKVRKQRDGLERRLTEIEQAIMIFSKEKVFVRDD